MNPPSKTPVTVSVLLTVILLLFISGVAFFMQIILMNGVMSSSQTGTALTTSLVCQGVDVILGAILAGRLTRLFMTRFNLNKVVAVIVAILPVTVFAVVLSVAAIIFSFAVAGIK